METVKAKHTVGDQVHVKILLKDDRACMPHYGEITGARLHPGVNFRDRILYDLWLEQADAPHIRIENMPEYFVLAGGPPDEPAEE